MPWGIWIANVQGDILTACCVTTDEKTEDERQRMGYQRLLTASPAAQSAAGTGMAPADMGEVGLEACIRRSQGRQDSRRIGTHSSWREMR